MYQDPNLRRGRPGAVFAIIVAVAMCYLIFAALQGEHGLVRLFQAEAQEQRLVEELDALRAERAALADKTQRLSADRLDLDLLDERARKVLGLGRSDELLIR